MLNRLAILLFALSLTLSTAAQKKTVQRKARTAQTAKTKTPAKKTVAKPARKTQKKTPAKAQPATPTVKGLQNQRQQLQKQIKEQELKLQANRKNVKQRLENLQIINTEIADKRRTIDTIRHDIGVLDDNISTLNLQMQTQQKKLDERRTNYMQSMRYMHRNRSLQNRLMFVFGAQNFTQMYRRMRFAREYAKYQRAQGEAVQTMMQLIAETQDELSDSKRQKSGLLQRGEQERRNLEGKQAEQQKVVSTLQREQKTIEALINEQRKKDIALNAQIEKLIAEEIARAKARAEAEARAKARAEAEAKRKAAEAAAKKRAEELARKKAAAEAAARENARRIAEAKEREERAKQQALAAAKKSAEEKRAAERAAREAEEARRTAERKADEEAKAHEREMAEAVKKAKEEKKAEKESFTLPSEDRQLSGSFESNRGRLPMPLTGSYRIVNGFGQQEVEGLKGVRIDSKGINIKGQPGAQVRSVYDGVAIVTSFNTTTVVMVRHGEYISVYANMGSVAVRSGQRITTRQTLGTVDREGILHFQLRKSKTPLNPIQWLSRN